MTDAYLREWATGLAIQFAELGALADISLMRATELTGLILFLEGYRAHVESLVT